MRSRFSILWVAVVFGITIWQGTALLLGDELELLTGSKGTGTILSESEDSFEFEFIRSGETVQRTIPKSRVHAATQNGKRRIITEKTDENSAAPPSAAVTASSPPVAASTTSTGVSKPATTKPAATVTRTAKQVASLIEQQGNSPPDWLAATPLDFPQTLDLSFADPPRGAAWDNQKNIGQYTWDIINPNQGRWQKGVKLMVHLLDLHKNNPQTTRKIQQTLGDFYFKFFQDYPRAAYWWTKAGVAKNPAERPHLAGLLAECYWKLGSKDMASDLLDQSPITLHHIKLYADMGNLSRALKLAEQIARTNQRPDFVYIYAGDACRTAGDLDKAIDYYKKVLAVPEAPNRTRDHMQRNTKRAAANIIGINAFNRLDITKIPDGTYKGDSVGFAGNLYVAVTVKNKRITQVTVTQHEEKQYYSSLDDIPRQIVERQSLKNFDAVSGATATSEAIINAAAKALMTAQRQ